MGHTQPPNTCGNGQNSGKQHHKSNKKKLKSRAIDSRFYWVRDIIGQNNFHIFWEEGKKNLADYVTKHHPIWHHITT